MPTRTIEVGNGYSVEVSISESGRILLAINGKHTNPDRHAVGLEAYAAKLVGNALVAAAEFSS